MKKKGKKNKTRKIKKKKLPKILKKQVASQKSTSTEEKVVKELSQPPSENTVIEQELLNEERTDSDTEE